MKQPSAQRLAWPPPHAPAEAIDTATLDLLARWKAQDATTNPEQLQAAEREVTEFKKAMNDNRTAAGERLLFP